MKLSDKKIQQHIGWGPFPAQDEIIHSDAKEKVVVCGRRFGKTQVASYMALRTLLSSNKKIWVVAPSYDLTKKVYNEVFKWVSQLLPAGAYEAKNRPFPYLKTAGNSTLEGKSAENPVQLLGEELDLIIVDEAARISRNVWQQYLFPTTHDRSGRTVFISTPKGKNWLWEQWLKAKKHGGAFHYESRERPDFEDSEWERAKHELPEDLFNQEYRAWFIDAAGTVFKTDEINKIINTESLREPEKGAYYVMGVDFAKHKDYFVITVIDESTKAVVYNERSGGETYTYQRDRILEVARKYNDARVVIDSTGVGEPVHDMLFDEGLLVEDFHFSNQSKRKLIDKLRIFIEDGHLTIPNKEDLIDELKSFRMDVTPAGNITYSAPEGHHDDCVDSLALAVWELDKEINPAKQEPAIKKELKKNKRNPSFV